MNEILPYCNLALVIMGFVTLMVTLIVGYGRLQAEIATLKSLVGSDGAIRTQIATMTRVQQSHSDAIAELWSLRPPRTSAARRPRASKVPSA